MIVDYDCDEAVATSERFINEINLQFLIKSCSMNIIVDRLSSIKAIKYHLSYFNYW